MKPLGIFLSFLILLFSFSFKSESSAQEEKNYDSSVVIVSVFNGEKLESEYEVKKFLFSVGDSYIYSVYVPEGRSVEDFIEELNSKDYVEFAEPNFIYRVNVIPNDDFLFYQWNLQKIQAFDTWELTTGSDNVVVAIVDTGVDYNHPDLQSNLWKNPDEVCDNGIDDDNNGYIDDCYGWDAYKEIGNGYRGDHGTHVAGIIAAVANNTIGVAGVAPGVKVLSCNASNLSGRGLYHEDIAECFAYILKQKFYKGVNVVAVNGSFGGYNYSKAAEKFIELLDKFGLIFVVAAGNERINNDKIPAFPCSYRTDNVICVGATDINDKKPYYSNYGFNTVHISAPGDKILSTVRYSVFNSDLNTYGYMEFSGTSMASPHVAAAVGLLKSFEPDLTPAQVRERILSTAEPVSSLYGKNSVCGRLNIYDMLIDNSPPKFCMNLSSEKEYEFSADGISKFGMAVGVVRNAGKQPFVVNSVTLTNPQYFHILVDECSGKSLEFMEECRIKIAYTHPNVRKSITVDDIKTKLNISTNIGDYTFNLKGIISYGYNPQYIFEVSKRNVLFKNVSVGSSKETLIKVKNVYGDDIRIDIRDSHNPNFTVDTKSVEKPCKKGIILEDGDYCYLKIVYNPQEEGTHYTLVSVIAKSPDKEDSYWKNVIGSVNISATGSTISTPDIQIFPDTEIVKIVKDKKGTITKQFTIRNNGTEALLIKEIEFVTTSTGLSLDKSYGSNPCGDSTVLQPGESCTFGVSFYADREKGYYKTFLRVSSNDKLEKDKFIYIEGVIDKSNINIEPSKVKFKNTMVGKEQETTVRIYNKSKDYPVDITKVEPENKTDFSIDTFGGNRPCGNVPFEIQEEDFCTISVKFRPQTTGKKKTTVNIHSGTYSKQLSVEGVGIEPSYPQMIVSPQDYDFGSVVVGSSRKQFFEIRNDGFSELSISEIKFKAKEFTINLSDGNSPCGNPPFNLQPGNRCTFSVTFSPQKDKQSKASIEIKSNDPSSNKFKLQITGKGRYQNPVISVSPESYDFGVILLGSYKEKEFYIENTGEKPLNIYQTKLKGKSFAITQNTCSSLTLQPGESCSFTVRFLPQKDKREKASIEIKSNDPENKKLKVQIYGSGKSEASILKLEPDGAVIDFGKQKVGDKVKKVIKILNSGNVTLKIYELKFKSKGNFSVDLNSGDRPCSKSKDISINSKDYCTFGVSFEPDDVDKFESYLEIKSNDPNNKKLKVRLVGFGRPYPSPVLSLSTREINLSLPIDYACSNIADIVIRNSGEEKLNFIIERNDKNFLYFSTCYESLEPGDSCYVSVEVRRCRYVGKLKGKTIKGKLTIVKTNDPSEEKVEIPINVHFYDPKTENSNVVIDESDYPTEAFIYVGEISYPYVLKVKNRSTGVVNVKDINLTNSSEFILDLTAKGSFASHLNDTYSCKTKQFTLYPNEFCYIYVYFVPKSEGLKKTDVVITEEDGSTYVYKLTASAIKSNSKYVFIDPEVFDEFPFVLPGQESDVKELKVRNLYDIPVKIDRIVKEDDTENNFEVVIGYGDKPCNSDVEVQSHDYCTFGLKFHPVDEGVKRAKVKVFFKDSPVQVTETEVIGRSTDSPEPHIVVTPRQIVTGLQFPKTVSEAYEISIKNIGTDALNITDIYPINDDTTLINLNYGKEPCGSKTFTLNPDEYCTIGIIYSPEDINDSIGSVIIESNDTLYPLLKVYIYSDPDERYTLRREGCSFGGTSTIPVWMLISVFILFRRFRKSL